MSEWAQPLRSAVEVFDREAFRLGDRVHEWLLSGESDSPPQALLSGPGADMLSRPTTVSDVSATARAWALVGAMPGPVARRWLALVTGAVSQLRWSSAGAPPPQATWLPDLLAHLQSAFPQGEVPLAHPDLERLLELSGADPSTAVTFALSTPTSRYHYGVDTTKVLPARMPGWSAAVARHLDHVGPMLDSLDASTQVQAAPLLAALEDDVLSALASTLCTWATDPSLARRKAAAPLLARIVPAALPVLRRLATSGQPGRRRLALERVGDLGTPEDRAWAVDTATADRAAQVRAIAGRWDGQGPRDADSLPPGSGEADGDTDGVAGAASALPELPTPRWVAGDAASCRDLVRALAEHVDALSRSVDLENAARLAADQPYRLKHAVSVPPDWWTLLEQALQDPRPPVERRSTTTSTAGRRAQIAPHDLCRIVRHLLGHPALTPEAALVLLHEHDALLDPDGTFSAGARMVLEDLHGRGGRPDLLELSVMLEGLGLDGPAVVADSCLHVWGGQLARDWPDEHLAAFAVRYGDRAARVLGTGAERRWGVVVESAARILRSGPLSCASRDALYDVALGTAATDRDLAQDLLAGDPERRTRIAAALQDGRGEARAVAARWAGRTRLEDLVPEIERAYRAERQDSARSALLDALARLGCSPRRVLDLDQLHRQARQAAEKPVPADLEWFPWETLPDLRWQDGELVDPLLVRWLVLRAHRAKSAAPDALTRHLLGDTEAADRERLGLVVLTAWLRQDLRPIDRATAERHARDRAQFAMRMSAWQAQREGTPDPHAGRSLDEVAARYLPQAMRIPVASATSSKGVLAVAAACGGRRLVEPAVAYVREWYGNRPAQSRALVVMLAWLDDDLAVQQVLSIAARFRTKSIQQEAQAQVLALADRHRWSLAELGDRTVPTAGLDDDGRLVLDYGARTFTALLERDATLSLRGPSGDRVSSLPAPRRDDDEELATAARRRLAASRKELKSLVALQTSRLHEAFCTERRWPLADWRTYLLGHPVVAVLARRLVWILATEGSEPVAVRSLEDGTLLDVDDRPVDWPMVGTVTIAHDVRLTPEAVSAWQRHLDDYDIVPLFAQLGREPVPLETLPEGARAVEDREGWLVGSFALRGRATRLGWVRGSTEDGGWFYTYLKAFPAVGLVACIRFSGNQLPEVDRTVALERLTVHRDDDPAVGSDQGVRLAELPTVLVSQLWADLREMAADGDGYRHDWEDVVNR